MSIFRNSLFRNPYRVQASSKPATPKPALPARTSKKFDEISEFEMDFFRAGKCPDCEHEKFLEGPHGGLCVNFKCANPACGSEFNDMGPFGIQRISDRVIQ